MSYHIHYICKFSVFHSTLTKLLGKIGLRWQEVLRMHKILTGRVEVSNWFSLGNNSTKNNTGVEVILNVRDTLHARLTPNCHLVCLDYTIEKPPPLWNAKLTPKTVEASHVLHPTTCWLYQKINIQQVILPLKKEDLHLKTGMRWDSLLKNVSRAPKNLHLQNSW